MDGAACANDFLDTRTAASTGKPRQRRRKGRGDEGTSNAHMRKKQVDILNGLFDAANPRHDHIVLRLLALFAPRGDASDGVLSPLFLAMH